MKTKNKTFLVGSLALITLGACSSVHKTGDTEATRVSRESTRLAEKENAAFVTDLSFDQGSSRLSSSDQRKLDEIINRAKANGRIDDVKVMSWSDAEYPTQKKGRLSDAQNRIASRRAESIKRYLRGLDNDLDIDTFNMASQPGALSKLFNTENAKIKRSLEAAGIAHDDGTDQHSEKAGKSTVMVILEE